MRRAALVAAALLVACLAATPVHAAAVRMAFYDNGGTFVRESDGTTRAMTNFDVDNVRGIEWSPDGTQMAGVADDGKDRLIVFDADEASPVTTYRTLVTPLEGERVDNVGWSPNANDIVFGVEVNQQRHIEIVNVATKVRHPVPNTTDAFWPTYTPEGDRLLFVRDNGLATIKLDGTDEQRLRPDAVFTGSLFNPTFSPDGRLIAVVSVYGTQGFDIFVVPVEGPAPARKLGLQSREGECSGPGLGSWLSDNAHLVASFGHCSFSPKPDRIVQIGVNDGSFVDVPLPHTGEHPNTPKVFGDGLVVPIPQPAPVTAKPIAMTTTSLAAGTTTTTQESTTTTVERTMALAHQEDKDGSNVGLLVTGAVLTAGAATGTALRWRSRRVP
jgi:Tol biopolymer transport system component